MSVLNQLACSLNRRDEIPNQILAKKIVSKKDEEAVEELVLNLSNKNKNIQSDCIKVLYEIGEVSPALIAKHLLQFVALLTSKNNRLQWGAMAAIDSITLENTKETYALLPKLLDAANKGSVITRDHAVNVLIKLASIKLYKNDSVILLQEQLRSCPVNQLAMYAERSLPVVDDLNRTHFINLYTKRIKEIEKESMKKRIEKVIREIKQ